SCNVTTAVTGIAFSRDGTLLATGGDDGDVKVWPIMGDGLAQPINTIGSQRSTRVAFSPDSQTIAVGSGAGAVSISAAKVASGGVPYTGLSTGVRAIGFSTDGMNLVAIDDTSTLVRWM